MRPLPLFVGTQGVFILLAAVVISLPTAAAETSKNEDIPVVTPFVKTVEFGGPLFNAGSKLEGIGKTVQSSKFNTEVRRLAPVPSSYTVSGRGKPIVKALTRGSQKTLKDLTSRLKGAGLRLEKYGKYGGKLDDLANLSEGAGSLYEKDWVGVGQAATNTGLSALSAAGGAWLGAKSGAVAGFVVGGPPGAAVGSVVGVIGGIGGAIAGSYAYNAYGKPELDKAMDEVSKELQRKEELANKLIRRVETDRILLEQNGQDPLDILFGPNGRSAFEDSSRVESSDISDRQAELIHERAEKIRAQQMEDRVQKIPPDGIDKQIETLIALRKKTIDSEAKGKLEREIELLVARERENEKSKAAAITQQAEALARQKLAADEVTKKAEEAARLKAEDDAKRKEANEARLIEEEARRKAVERQKQQEAADAKKKSDEEAKRKADEAAKLKAEEAAKLKKTEEDAKRCGPNGSPDGAGDCFCDPGFESVSGTCVPICGQGEVRGAGSRCVKGYNCGTHSDCPSGFACNPTGICVDNRPSGEDAVLKRKDANQGLRGQSGSSQLPLYPLGSTSKPERFGLSQMPGGLSQVLTPLMGAPDTSSGNKVTSPEQPQQSGPTTTPLTPSDIACGAGGKCPTGYTCNSLTGVCIKQPQVTSTTTIATCTTDRDCPGAKCVNNVCTSPPAAPLQPTKPTTAPSAQQTRQWYVLEAVAGFSVCDLGSTCTAAHKVPCTLTYWAAYGLVQSELPEALQRIGKDLMRLVGAYENAHLITTRVYQGPSVTELKTPVSGPPSKLECKKP